MPLFDWQQGWEPLRDLERQVDRLLENIRFPVPPIRLNRAFPPVNMYELEHEYLLTAALPGTVASNLELTVSGGVLTLKGERVGPSGVPDDRFRRHERFWGKWQRSFSLPDRVEETRVAAEFSDGILKIHLPKANDVQARQIPVVANT